MSWQWTIDVTPAIDFLSSHIILSIVILLALVEAMYLFVITNEKKSRKSSWVEYTLSAKAISLFISLLSVVAIGFIIAILPILAVVLGCITIIAGYVKLNELLARRYAKEETKEDEAKRLKEEDKKFRFKVGQRVKIIHSHPDSDLRNGKVVKITERKEETASSYKASYDFEGNDLTNNWRETRFTEIRGGKKR